MDIGTHTKRLILAVDDEAELLLLFRIAMKSRGFQVETSVNAENLWEILNKSQPDVIFLDIHMKGIDGGQLCKQLKKNKHTAHIPVIMLSGNDDLIHVARSSGADGFVYKPFEASKIVREIDRVLGSYPPVSEAG